MSLSAFSGVRTYTHSYQDEHTSKTLSCTIAQSVSRDGQADHLYQGMYNGSSEAVSTMYILQKAPHRYEETGSASSRETTGKSRCPRPKHRLWQRCMDRIPYSTACGSRLRAGGSVWPRAGGKSRAKIVPISLLPCCSPPPGTLPSIGASTTLSAASGRPPAPACRRRCTPRLGARRVRPACQALGALAAAPHLSQHRALRC